LSWPGCKPNWISFSRKVIRENASQRRLWPGCPGPLDGAADDGALGGFRGDVRRHRPVRRVVPPPAVHPRLAWQDFSPAAGGQIDFGQAVRTCSMLMAAAQRGELADAYARLHETAERAIIGRAIELARATRPKPPRWLASRG